MRSPFLVLVIMVVFFVISLVTNVVGPMVPDIIQGFHLSLTLAGFLPFSFFAAYAVMSIPAGILIEKSGEKAALLAGFALALAGALLLASLPRYATALPALFLIGLGMATLQVAINPLLRVAGGEGHYAFNAVLAQLIFGLASFASPLVYSWVIQQLSGGEPAWLARLVPAQLPWVSMYWLITLVLIGMLGLLAAVSVPRVERTRDEQVGAWSVHRELLGRGVVWSYFLGVFAYVGLEQGLSNWMSQFLAVQHHYDPQAQGAMAVSHFWGLMTVGCLLGLVLLKLLDSRHVLVAFSLAALGALSCALFGGPAMSLSAFGWLGFTLSVMWSVIFSLALNSLEDHHGTFSGILCTAIVGGAVVPLLIGSLSDLLGGLRAGLCFLYLPLAYILSIGIWARPLITNQRL